MKIAGMNKWWYVVIIALFILFAIALIWNPRDTAKAAGIGSGIIFVSTMFEWANPAAGKPAYFDKQAGRRVHANGKPYYTIDDDIRKYGKLMGSLWWFLKYFGTAILIGAVFGVFIYGIVAIVKIISTYHHGDYPDFLQYFISLIKHRLIVTRMLITLKINN